MAGTRAAVELVGDRELRNLLAVLPKRVAAKGNRAAVTAAATPIVRSAKANAKKQSGLLKKAMGKKVKTYKGGTTAVAIIGAKRDVQGTYKGRNRVPANYIHLVSEGTRHSRPDPFLKKAYAANRDNAVQIAGQKLKEVVEKEAARLGRR